MREQRQRLVLLGHKAYGDGRLGMNSVGEWFWIQQDGGRVYLGWSATGAARRLNAVISANQRQPATIDVVPPVIDISGRRGAHHFSGEEVSRESRDRSNR